MPHQGPYHSSSAKASPHPRGGGLDHLLEMGASFLVRAWARWARVGGKDRATPLFRCGGVTLPKTSPARSSQKRGGGPLPKGATLPLGRRLPAHSETRTTQRASYRIPPAVSSPIFRDEYDPGYLIILVPERYDSATIMR